MGRRIQQSTSTRSQAASARSELGPTTLTSRSMRLPPVRARGRARGRRLHMSKRSQQLANPTGRQENAFTRLRDSSPASPTIATTDDQSNVATRSVTSSTKAQQPDANNTPKPVDYSSLTDKNLKSIFRDRGLQVSGRKADLVQRLEEYDKLFFNPRAPTRRPRARTGGIGGSRIDGNVSVVGPNSDRADAACDRVDVDCCILRPIVVYGLIDGNADRRQPMIPATNNTSCSTATILLFEDRLDRSKSWTGWTGLGPVPKKLGPVWDRLRTGPNFEDRDSNPSSFFLRCDAAGFSESSARRPADSGIEGKR
ncbi:hypothetical protein THAOC_22535, partial [Thalassiosira oceanica]